MTRLIFDLETDGLHLQATKVWCLCIKDATGGPESPVESFSDEIAPDLQGTLEQGLQRLSEATELIGHNIIDFDFYILLKFFGWIPDEKVTITDTLVKSRLQHPDRRRPANHTGKSGPHSIEAWGYRVGRGKVDNEVWSVFSPTILHRCREDVAINYLTDISLSQEGLNADWKEAYSIEQDFQRIVSAQAITGVNVDQGKMQSLLDTFNTGVDKIDSQYVPKLPPTIKQKGVTVQEPFKVNGEYKKLVSDWYYDVLNESIAFSVGGPFTKIEITPFDIGSIHKVKEYFLEHGWKPTEWNYSKKTRERTSPQLTEDSFETINGEMPRAVKERLMLCNRRSAVQGWFGRLRRDGRLTAGVNACGCNTGRVRHIGVANIPRLSSPYGKAMRSVFCASPGYMFVGHDAKGIEIRMLAHYMNDTGYINTVLTREIHGYHQELLGLPTRDGAKTFIYAFLYGEGDEKLGIKLGGGKEDGRRFKEDFLESLPALDRLLQDVEAAAAKGWIKGLDGRRIYLRRDQWGKVKHYTALNALLQGGATVIMKKSAIILDESVRAARLDARKVIDYHDEAQWEVRLHHCHQYMELAADSIVKAGEYFNLNIPLAADVSIGKDWSDTH